MSVVLVTDSTAYLPEDLVADLGITVVPLQMSADGVAYTEGVDLPEEQLSRLLKRSRTLTTSRPSPTALLEAYERLAEGGATEVVSVHLSSELSGTCDAAILAARAASIPVRVVDSTTIGMALGHAVLTGARLGEGGADAGSVVEAVTRRAAMSDVFFYVHTLEFLRRGGRIGNAAALLGSALAVRPLLRLEDGRIDVVEKVRTAGRALARLVELVGERADASETPVSVTVHHLQDEERAQRLAGQIVDRLGDRLAGDDVWVRPIGAVAAVHLGPGAMAVAISPELPD